jgi:type II secretory pathway pseudopilin PulG
MLAAVAAMRGLRRALWRAFRQHAHWPSSGGEGGDARRGGGAGQGRLVSIDVRNCCADGLGSAADLSNIS